jgi:hypothetical protein
VLTQHNDLNRSGANLAETTLTVSKVNSGSFGLLFTRPVDDQIYAQPLLVPGVDVPGQGRHDLIIVGTVNDTVYAFDAADPSVTTPYWTRSFINPPSVVAPRNTDMTGACGGQYQDFSGNFGIVGTPVIDPTTSRLYVVARTKENGTTFVQRLHALDVATGAERPKSPVVITAVSPGNGDGSVGGVITFDPQKQNQRAGLVLANGIVYITWSSHCDWGPYHGWVIGYDASSLEQKVVYNDTPEGYDGGIWMSGQAPAVDQNGNIYLVTGNGSVGLPGQPQAVINRGESFLKLMPNGTGLDVASWFTPYNWQDLENGDTDLGSGGLLLVPGTNLAFAGGKQGIVYLVNRDHMGGLSQSPTGDTNVVQSFQVSNDQVHGGAVWWEGPGGPYAYIWPSSVQLQQYRFDRAAGKFVLPAIALGLATAPTGQPGGILSLSANGTESGTGIVWVSHQLQGDANQQVQPGILRAYNAENVTQELYNSEQVSSRDRIGTFAKFCAPTVANGKVYLATFSNRLNVYGLLPPPALSVTRNGSEVGLSWPAPTGASYSLQVSPNLRSGSWTHATNAVGVSSGVAHVTVAATASTAFYRLAP